MSRKFYQFSSRLNEINTKDTDAKTLTYDNRRRMEILVVENNNLSLKPGEYIRRPEELKDLADNKLNNNACSNLFIHVVNLPEK